MVAFERSHIAAAYKQHLQASEPLLLLSYYYVIIIISIIYIYVYVYIYIYIYTTHVNNVQPYYNLHNR